MPSVHAGEYPICDLFLVFSVQFLYSLLLPVMLSSVYYLLNMFASIFHTFSNLFIHLHSCF